MSEVFISYAKEDASTARMLAEALQRAGFSVWWDRHIPPGKTWDDVIGRALDDAACILVLWSKVSVESRWVREEAERASNRGCLIPVLVERVDPPFGFRRVEAADLVQWNGDENDPEFLNLRAAVSDFVKAAARATAPQAQTTASRGSVDDRMKTEPAGRKKGSKVIWIAAGLIGIAVAGVYIAQWRSNSSPPPSQPSTGVLPSVVGLSLADAKQLLTSKGFVKIIPGRKVSSEDEPGTVIQQDPLAGTNLPLDSSVRVIVATRRSSGDESGSSAAEPQSPRTESLSAPQQVSPASGTVFNHYPRSTTLVWKAVAGASSYSLEHTFLGPGQHCSSISGPGHRVANLKETIYTFNFVGAQPGCWRVWAVDERGNEGPKSPWWEFVYTR